jgi:hypothetical protein
MEMNRRSEAIFHVLCQKGWLSPRVKFEIKLSIFG